MGHVSEVRLRVMCRLPVMQDGRRKELFAARVAEVHPRVAGHLLPHYFRPTAQVGSFSLPNFPTCSSSFNTLCLRRFLKRRAS
eukprot:2881486-Alexandrium_andersonii.AAC.1